MHGDLVFVFISKDNFSECRIRDIAGFLMERQDCIFLITTPTKKSFKRCIQEIGAGVNIYNRGDYIEPAQILSALWGFKAIWIFYEESNAHFDLSENISVNGLTEQFLNSGQTLEQFLTKSV